MLKSEFRRQIITRAHGCCEYCKSQAQFATQAFSIEHIIPRSHSGTDTADNLALACQGCNNHKYNRIAGQDPLTGEEVPLYNPRKQKWQEHFAWSDDYTLIIANTNRPSDCRSASA